MENTAELFTLNGRQYVLVNKFIAIRVDALAEDYGRKFTQWKAEPKQEDPAQLSFNFPVENDPTKL